LETQDAIVGVWRLEAFQVRDVDTAIISEPFGLRPRGIMMFHPGGRMVALITPCDRPHPTNESERSAAFQNLVACSGAYRLEPPDRFVIDVDVAWFEPWVGSEQVRTYRLHADRLDIVSTPTRLPQAGGSDLTVVATLTWRREA
jgi:hypothetical protein